jgi:hypothetical protein
MSVKNIFLIAFLLHLFSCGDKKTEASLSALDNVREFIQATRSGDFKVAERFLMKDDQNIEIFNGYKKQYDNLPATKKIELSKSAYVINNIDEINDSVIIINYSNGYSDKPMNLKVARKNKEWQVDLK